MSKKKTKDRKKIPPKVSKKLKIVKPEVGKEKSPNVTHAVVPVQVYHQVLQILGGLPALQTGYLLDLFPQEKGQVKCSLKGTKLIIQKEKE